MSRAFVNEGRAANRTASPVERRSGTQAQPNYVTAHGLQQLQERLTMCIEAQKVEQARGVQADKRRLSELERDLRHLRQRVRSAQLIPPATSRNQVQIGSRVAFADARGHEHEVQLVGEDEADDAAGKIHWSSPLGSALLGAAPGDEVVWPRPSGDCLIDILEIIPQS